MFKYPPRKGIFGAAWHLAGTCMPVLLLTVHPDIKAGGWSALCTSSDSVPTAAVVTCLEVTLGLREALLRPLTAPFSCLSATDSITPGAQPLESRSPCYWVLPLFLAIVMAEKALALTQNLFPKPESPPHFPHTPLVLPVSWVPVLIH